MKPPIHLKNEPFMLVWSQRSHIPTLTGLSSPLNTAQSFHEHLPNIHLLETIDPSSLRSPYPTFPQSTPVVSIHPQLTPDPTKNQETKNRETTKLPRSISPPKHPHTNPPLFNSSFPETRFPLLHYRGKQNHHHHVPLLPIGPTSRDRHTVADKCLWNYGLYFVCFYYPAILAPLTSALRVGSCCLCLSSLNNGG